MNKEEHKNKEVRKNKEERKKKEKPKYNMWQITAFMVSIAWKQKEKKVLVLGLLLVVLSLAINLTDLFITPVVLGAVESRAALGTLLATILAFLLMSTVFRAAQTYVNTNWLYGKITVRSFLNSMRNHKTATTSYPNVQDKKFQQLDAKAFNTMNWNGAAGEAIWQTLTDLLGNVAGFIIYLLMLSAVNPLLFAFITILTLAGYFLNKYLNEYRYRHREEDEEINRYFRTIINYAEQPQMAKDIRLFGMVPWLMEIRDKMLAAKTDFARRVENVVIWGRIADLVIAFLRNGVVYAYLITLVLDGALDVPLFLLYFSAAGGFSSWVTGIMSNFLTLRNQSLELSGLREVLDYPEPFRFEEGESLVPETDKKYEIRLEDVSFRYPEAEEDTLSHISLTLHPGEKLALVGLNGAGKTTLIKLLCGFLDPTSGRVLLDGKDIREYNRRDYYQLFSAVFQDFTLLPVTLAANVAQTTDQIDMERVRDCVERAGLKSKAESLPKGYDTLLNREIYEDAAMLSGGETQRLMLARALYKNAPFVILDEPTAALDPIAEADLYGKYNEMTKGRSSVYISHRLASTRFCDRILLIEDGRLIEEGTHESLLAQGGRYAELFEVQSRYYKEGVEPELC